MSQGLQTGKSALRHEAFIGYGGWLLSANELALLATQFYQSFGARHVRGVYERRSLGTSSRRRCCDGDSKLGGQADALGTTDTGRKRSRTI